MTTLQRTPLYENHCALHAHMVNFGGWEMPIHYGSQLKEHHQVRQDAGVFDVSHMTIIDLEGPQTRDFLSHLLANDVGRLRQIGKALYSCLLNPQGGVIDDLIVYYLAEEQFRLVTNAATREKDLAWLQQQITPFQSILTVRDDLAMLAIQGPQARMKTLPTLPQALQSAAEQLTPFTAAWHEHWFVARTGYTGEDGFEVMLPSHSAPAFWQQLCQAGIAPIGLGARDTLRLEAAMNLYGTDMDETITPLESGLAWTVAWEPQARHFIGRAALEQKRAQVDKQLRVGLILEGKGVLRNHLPVFAQETKIGLITSGGFSPTLGRSIAMARIAAGYHEALTVEIRGQRQPVRLVKLPFVRNGKAAIG